jgi:NhaP-type Na+/H+ or K+/H+ antiporter
MMQAVRGFNGQLERIVELVMVMAAGAMLSYIRVRRGSWRSCCSRSSSRVPCRLARAARRDQHIARPAILISWFGIRGVGTIFYLMYAINHGVPSILAEQLIGFTLTTVAASVVLHGISVTPLMTLYARRRAGERR